MKKSKKTNVIQQNVTVPDNMSKDDMIAILSSAILKAEELKVDKEAEKQRHEDEKWHKKIGLRDYSNKKWISRIVLTFLNTIGCLFRILFLPQKEISGNRATNALMKLSVIFIFRIARIILYINAICAVLNYPAQYIFKIVKQQSLTEYLQVLLYAFLSIVFAQLFRMAEIETEKMQDKHYIVEIFAAVMAVVAIIVK